jgi:hypothetical protein
MNKHLRTLSVETDSGRQRVSIEKCTITGDAIIRFGSSYTLRAHSGEVEQLFEAVNYTLTLDRAGKEEVSV